MSYAILMLAMHPKVDEKLYNEITEYFKVGDDLNYDMVKRMPYLDMVVKEVLRLFPAVPGTVRETLSDTFIGEKLDLKSHQKTIQLDFSI